MLPTLPTEILELILHRVTGLQDLYNSCLVSRLFSQIVRPHLYSRLTIHLIQYKMWKIHEWIFWDYLTATSACLLRCLRQYSHLAPLVRTFVFSFVAAEHNLFYHGNGREEEEEDDEEKEEEEEEDGEEEVNGVETFFSTLSMFPKLQRVILDDPCDFDLIDRQLYFRQRRIDTLTEDHSSPPFEMNLISFHPLHRRSFDGEEQYSLLASYSALRITPYAAWRWYTPLPNAQLRTLSIPLTKFAFSNLPHLEHLELNVDSNHSIDSDEWFLGGELECLIETVSKSIKALPNSLETVILIPPATTFSSLFGHSL